MPETRRWGPLAAGALLCAAVYLPRINAPLVWDDVGTIVMNRALERPIPLRDFLSPRYFDFSGEQTWRPLATLSYCAMIRLFGRRPWAMRGAHLAMHGANGLLLAGLATALGFSAEAAAWAAAFFWVHAAHTETLFCVSFNEEILCGLGLLLMAWGHRRRRTLVAALGLAFALLSKETGIIGLPLVVLLDLLGLGRARGERAKTYAAYAAVAAPYLYVHTFPLKGPGGTGEAFSLPASERLYYALSSLTTAARVFLAPLRLRIEYFALPPASAWDWLRWGGTGALILAAWPAWAARLRRENPPLAFLVLWPLPFLALTSGLIPVRVLNMRLFAERWMYLPYLGACAALAHLLRRRPRWAAAVLVFWGACGWLRASDWTDETRLWSSLLDVYPWCAKAEEGLAEAYSRRSMYPDALAAYQRALELRRTRRDRVLARYAPLSTDGFVRWDSPIVFRGLGRTYLRLGRLEEAARAFLRASELDPRDGYTYDVMAYQYAAAGDFKKSKEWVDRGLRALPEDAFLLRIEPDVLRRRLTFKARFN